MRISPRPSLSGLSAFPITEQNAHCGLLARIACQIVPEVVSRSPSSIGVLHHDISGIAVQMYRRLAEIVRDVSRRACRKQKDVAVEAVAAKPDIAVLAVEVNARAVHVVVDRGALHARRVDTQIAVLL